MSDFPSSLQIKSSSIVDVSSNAVLSLACEVDDSLRCSPSRPSSAGTETPHFEPPFRYRAYRFPRRPSELLPASRAEHPVRSKSSSGGGGGGGSCATDDQAILEKYNPVRFAFRRVMQIGNDRSWRHVALGSSRVQTIMTNLAQSFLRYQQHSV